MNNEKRLDYIRQWKKANPDKVEEYRIKDLPKSRARGRKWYYKHHEENKLKMRQYHKEWVQKNKSKRKKIVRRSALKQYGLTEEQYEQLLNKQNNCCAIWDTLKIEGRNNLHIDHDHETGTIRGLLCSNCNTALGLLKENLILFNKAVNYLSRRNQ
jgi:Recombination endonuclease VII